MNGRDRKSNNQSENNRLSLTANPVTTNNLPAIPNYFVDKQGNFWNGEYHIHKQGQFCKGNHNNKDMSPNDFIRPLWLVNKFKSNIYTSLDGLAAEFSPYQK